ncbi:single- stranded DNA-binding family protein [Thermococcus thermotolerans]|uniref:single- stranded DNA-binding family protein n=1 Tax=Thermococcus thermotolerans TaxID=2969672 RepID=UPI0021570B56|nr:single- stranded DNA-binding family protein [Thermococcus thermotolerans]
MRLSTGFVRASGYAHKVRRVLFALTRKKVDPREVIRAAGELNQKIFEKLQELGVEKSDVIRITVPFRIEEGTIKWDYEGLSIEVYRKSEEEKLAMAMEEIEERERALEEQIKELEELALQLRETSEKILEKLEELKQEHTSLKLRAEE